MQFTGGLRFNDTFRSTEPLRFCASVVWKNPDLSVCYSFVKMYTAPSSHYGRYEAVLNGRQQSAPDPPAWKSKDHDRFRHLRGVSSEDGYTVEFSDTRQTRTGHGKLKPWGD